ncbi:hypothetical protein KC887_02310 [Candidatus Kaiserbacteria bacterium]|nr:hypothetical protein [Candidatus Kaiserbacteria bacterium]
MNLSQVASKVGHKLSANSPTILAGIAITGVVTTAYLAARAAVEGAEIIREDESRAGTAQDNKEKLKERAKLTWKLYIPAGVSAGVTIGCIVGSTRISNRRLAAAQAAFALTERAWSEYREKVIEEVGKQKEQKIRDELAQEHVNRISPASSSVVVASGDVLCCELYTDRFFTCSAEELRRAVNEVNYRLNQHDTVSLDDWYNLIGLNQTQHSGDLGWSSDKLMDLVFTTVLTPDEKPCLAFEYNYVKPIYEGLWG